jgi:hypothetical protein
MLIYSAVLYSVRLRRKVMFQRLSIRKSAMAQPLSGLGLKLADEEHDQECDELQNLLIAQLQFERKLDHGYYPRGTVSQRCSTAH